MFTTFQYIPRAFPAVGVDSEDKGFFHLKLLGNFSDRKQISHAYRRISQYPPPQKNGKAKSDKNNDVQAICSIFLRGTQKTAKTPISEGLQM